MARAYSEDLRIRFVTLIDEGQSARGTARLFKISESIGVKWAARWRREGSIAPNPVRGHRRPKLVEHADWLIAMIKAQPDLTLEEIQAKLTKRGVEVCLSTIWTFFERRGISFKKNDPRRRARPRGRRSSARRLAKHAS